MEVIDHFTEKNENSDRYGKSSYSWPGYRKASISFYKTLVKPLQSAVYSSGKPCSRRILIKQYLVSLLRLLDNIFQFIKINIIKASDSVNCAKLRFAKKLKLIWFIPFAYM